MADVFSSLDLIINAGGESRRMGRSKTLLPVPPDDTPLIAYVARRLAVLPISRVIVVANDPALPSLAQLPSPTIFVADAYPDAGALGGIATGLQQIAGWAVVVACDLPLVNPQVFNVLARIAAERDEQGDRWDAVVPVVGDYEEPLHALYHRRCLPAIEARLAQGQRRIISFMGDVRTRYVAEDELRAVDPHLHSFVNANTPAEWDAALQLLNERTCRPFSGD
jgi:molybdopterin-guanine dinucleotide biosynthesis protein A